ncbi:hypothetical protein GTW78_35910 [Streptomyces sp. SID4948]|nr:hypothetical protein [Streptomyces sp. SID4948]
MTAPDSLPLHALTEDNLAAASPDRLRAMVKTLADAFGTLPSLRPGVPPAPAPSNSAGAG